MAANVEEDEAIELGGFGVKGKITGRRIVTENGLVLVLFCALGWLLYNDHTANESQHQRLLDAIQENTYVLSLSQLDRERLRIDMPESLRRKLHRE